jgi:hypothetical protein
VVVVVVGATVVVVVVGATVVVVVATLPEVPSVLDGAVVVVVVVVDVELAAVGVVAVVSAAVEGALDPGCSSATTTPISTVKPDVATTAPVVSRRSRPLAWSRFSGVCIGLGGDMTGSFSLDCP